MRTRRNHGNRNEETTSSSLSVALLPFSFGRKKSPKSNERSKAEIPASSSGCTVPSLDGRIPTWVHHSSYTLHQLHVPVSPLILQVPVGLQWTAAASSTIPLPASPSKPAEHFTKNPLSLSWLLKL
ncbi:hypothetical protein MRB53_022535 [Persea americana]|uniref:Uncharacterized protein n=1 Tax=Persea americana TaxID=3435 RepID=A0ACC2L785_PERAE|nr:hypothetical protein MRB53_022535 [Persea americana]